MTVGQLIEILSTYHSDTPIYVHDECGDPKEATDIIEDELPGVDYPYLTLT